VSKFKVGDFVYIARAATKETYVMCPDCLGSGVLQVILGDKSIVQIECSACELGYHGSLGKILSYAYEATAERHALQGVEEHVTPNESKTLYHYNGTDTCYYMVSEENVFATGEEALLRAVDLKAEHDADEAKRLAYKTKPKKSWAWNVAYYRRGIREAEKEIARLRSKLAAAPKNVKEADSKESV
jgi:hypothetical protein